MPSNKPAAPASSPALKGFGSKTQSAILKGVEFIRAHEGHCRVDTAHQSAQSLLAVLRPHAQHFAIAGELRRARETVQQLDFVISSTDAEAATTAFVTHPEITEVLAPSAGRLSNGLQANLHVVSDDAFSAALHYYTGSEEHHAALRAKASERGLVLDKRGLWRDDERIECSDEAALFAALGLAYIPPELRENQGEVEAAAADTLPRVGNSRRHSRYAPRAFDLFGWGRQSGGHGPRRARTRL